MSKTPDYTKKAITNYQKTKDRLTILLDKGTKDKIKEKYGAGVNMTGYIKDLILNDLTKDEKI